jgi:hypothetical protein
MSALGHLRTHAPQQKISGHMFSTCECGQSIEQVVADKE